MDSVIWENGGKYDPSLYSVHDSFSAEFIEYVMRETQTCNSILDIGCNQGRFLRTLSENGYDNLQGVDVMCRAIDILNEYSAKNGKRISAACDTTQNFLPSLEDKSIDYFITYSATIELMHPSFNLFQEMKRICRKGSSLRLTRVVTHTLVFIDY